MPLMGLERKKIPGMQMDKKTLVKEAKFLFMTQDQRTKMIQVQKTGSVGYIYPSVWHTKHLEQ